jgi:hypothetical protein
MCTETHTNTSTRTQWPPTNIHITIAHTHTHTHAQIWIHTYIRGGQTSIDSTKVHAMFYEPLVPKYLEFNILLWQADSKTHHHARKRTHKNAHIHCTCTPIVLCKPLRPSLLSRSRSQVCAHTRYRYAYPCPYQSLSHIDTYRHGCRMHMHKHDKT